MEEKQWKRLADFSSMQTDDLQQVMYRYLAKPITITSKTIDKETGEEKPREEIVFMEGTYMDEQKIQKLQFTIGCMNEGEELSPIFVTSEYRQPMTEQGKLQVYEVLIDLGYDMQARTDIQKKVAVYAWRPQQAIQIASEYMSIYTDYAKKYCEIISVTRKPYEIDADTTDDLTYDKDDGINYYKVDVRVNWTHKDMGDPQHPYKDKVEYITDAAEVQDAREQAVAYVKEKFKEQHLLGYKVVKAQPYQAALIVPKEYSVWFTKTTK